MFPDTRENKLSIIHSMLCMVFLLYGTFNLAPPLVIAGLKLGPYSFADAPSMTLDIRTSVSDGLKSSVFVSQVGGIAFDGIAKPSKQDPIMQVEFNYVPYAKDGERLHAVFTGKEKKTYREIIIPLYDWLLFPIVAFANSESYACFTSQGRLKDRELELKHIQRGNWILNYHAALENTLLGLRLAQADFFTVIPEACDLPKMKGQYLLGNGERPPNIKINNESWRAFQLAAQAIKKDYTAILISDFESPVIFSLKNDKIVFVGEPVWSYVHYSKNTMDSAEAMLRQEIIARRQEINRETTSNGAPAESNFSKRVQVLKLLLSEYTEERIENRLAQIIDSFPAKSRQSILQPFSAQMTELIRRHLSVNASVYQALVTTMRYSAFFRWVKVTSPKSMQRLNSLARLSDTLKRINTPSILVVAE